MSAHPQTFWLANELPAGKEWDIAPGPGKTGYRSAAIAQPADAGADAVHALYDDPGLHSEGHLPQNRGKLFQRFVDFLLIKLNI